MLEVGDTLGPWRLPSVEPDKMRALAQVLRDPNPIHLDPNAVAKLGLGDRVINQGPANLAYIVNMLNTALPGARLEQLDARFLANVFGGDAVEASARVTAVETVPGGTRVRCEASLVVPERGPTVTALAVLLVPERR